MSTTDTKLSTSEKLIEIRERHNKTTNLDVVEAYAAHQARGWLLEYIKELEAEKTCTWKRQKLGTDWDEYDSWGTSCGEDFAIVEEWDDTPSKFCGNCGGKVKQALKEQDNE